MSIAQSRPQNGADEAPDTDLDVHVQEALVLVPGPATRHWLWRAAIPTLIGLILAARHVFWPALKDSEGHWSELITHIGIAFIVSGIVVFGYEWRSEHKKTAALIATLLNILNTHVTKVLRASDREAVRNALDDLAGADGKPFGGHFLNLADSIARLSRGGWTSQSYLRFLQHYLKELTEKAAGLADMSEQLESNVSVSGLEYHLLMPDAPTLVDVLVEATMRELSERGGEYYAVSDAATWERLGAFRRAHDASLGRFNARRIFVLGRDSDNHLSPTRISEILSEHFVQSRAPEKLYEMKITSQEEYERLRVHELSEAVHFGIWAPRDKTPVAVFAIDDNLSNFRLAPAPRGMITAFAAIWRRLDDLTNEPLGRTSSVSVGQAILQDHVLAYRVGRMGYGARYRGVSMMSMWSEGGLRRFFAALAGGIESNRIIAKRVFVFDEPAARLERRVCEIIFEHERLAAETALYEWRVCLRSDLPAELDPPGVAMFEGDHGDPGQLLSEVAVGPTGSVSPMRIDAQPRAYETRVRIFDEFWGTLPREDSIRRVFGAHADEVLAILADVRNVTSAPG